MIDQIVSDIEHWQNLKPPLSPNREEIAIYQQLIGEGKSVCLLGMTKELIPLCTLAVDLNPLEIGKPTIKADWNELSLHVPPGKNIADVIIGDGIINFTKFQFVDKALSIADKLVCRVFMAKQQGMKYADWFPTEFPGSKKVIKTYDDIAIVLWEKS